MQAAIPQEIITIYFIHGNSNSADIWEPLFEQPILSSYKLLALELAGHGASGYASTPEDYNVIAIGKELAETIKRRPENQPYIICGFSLGSNVVAEMLCFGIRPRGLVLLSPTIVGSGVAPRDLNSLEIVSEVLFKNKPRQESVTAYFDLALRTATVFKPMMLANYYKTDPVFREGLLNSAMAGQYSDELQTINEFGIPTLMLSGLEDQVVFPNLYNNKMAPHVTVKSLPHTGHYMQLENPALTAAEIETFIQEILTDSPV